MARITGVRIWYADGEVASEWDESPDDGVQVVAWLDDEGGVTWAWGIDEYTYPLGDRVKHGSSIDDLAFAEMLADAHADLGRR